MIPKLIRFRTLSDNELTLPIESLTLSNVEGSCKIGGQLVDSETYEAITLILIQLGLLTIPGKANRKPVVEPVAVPS